MIPNLPGKSRNSYDSEEWSDKFNTAETKRLKAVVESLKQQIAGINVSDGMRGPAGPPGKDGRDGKPGQDGKGGGKPGPVGPAGVPGIKGDRGQRGETGSGVKGDRGDAGQPGARGETGRDGRREIRVILQDRRDGTTKTAIVPANKSQVTFPILEKGR